MELRAQPRPHQGDQGISRQNQQQCDQKKQGTHTGVEGRQDVRTLLTGTAAQHTHHGAVEGAIDPPQQDQQKPRQHIGVVVGVVGGAHTEGGRDHQLPHQPPHLAEQRAQGHHQCDALE